MCDKRDWAVTCVFCCYLHLTPMFSDPLQKDLFKVHMNRKLRILNDKDFN